jgi:signal-transduction protein with cAMP-binding, CBS, and nucleotidyltransferase domain
MRPVGTLVTGGPVSVDEKLTVRSLSAALGELSMGCALVRRDDEWVGIISERDVLVALSGDADPDEVWAADVMTEEIVTADAGERVLDAALRMVHADVRHLAVTDDGRIIGVVSMRDLFRVLVEGLVATS